LFEFGKARVILGPALSRSSMENAQLMIKQRTLKNVIRATGVGIHSGEKVFLTVASILPSRSRFMRVRSTSATPVCPRP
jgi:hypothetical protein